MEKEFLKCSKANLSWGWHNGAGGVAKGEGRDDKEVDKEGTRKKRRRKRSHENKRIIFWPISRGIS